MNILHRWNLLETLNYISKMESCQTGTVYFLRQNLTMPSCQIPPSLNSTSFMPSLSSPQTISFLPISLSSDSLLSKRSIVSLLLRLYKEMGSKARGLAFGITEVSKQLLPENKRRKMGDFKFTGGNEERVREVNSRCYKVDDGSKFGVKERGILIRKQEKESVPKGYSVLKSIKNSCLLPQVCSNSLKYMTAQLTNPPSWSLTWSLILCSFAPRCTLKYPSHTRAPPTTVAFSLPSLSSSLSNSSAHQEQSLAASSLTYSICTSLFSGSFLTQYLKFMSPMCTPLRSKRAVPRPPLSQLIARVLLPMGQSRSGSLSYAWNWIAVFSNTNGKRIDVFQTGYLPPLRWTSVKCLVRQTVTSKKGSLSN